MYQAAILDKSDEEGSTSSVGSNNPDYDPTDQPKKNYRSAQKYRSALPQQSWILVSKKPKRFKHQNTTAVHWGDTVTLKNTHTGIERRFISDKRIKQRSANSSSPVETMEF
jgi:hypothetical protein